MTALKQCPWICPQSTSTHALSGATGRKQGALLAALQLCKSLHRVYAACLQCSDSLQGSQNRMQMHLPLLRHLPLINFPW